METITAEQIHKEVMSFEPIPFDEVKAKRLQKLGFNVAQGMEDESDSEPIGYYGSKYPHKFISYKALQRVMNKYGLRRGDLRDFTGFVPEKNLEEMESFKLKKKDWSIDTTKTFLLQHDSSMYQLDSFSFGRKEISKEMAELMHKESKEKEGAFIQVEKIKLQIVAPRHEMGKSSKSAKPIVDPIVLCEVRHPSEIENCGFIIVTAWGDEASDEIIVNEKSN